MSDPFACPFCGGIRHQPGFVDDVVNGRIRWLPGPLRRSMWGNAKGRGLSKGLPVLAYRCTSCSRLELYAIDPDAPPEPSAGPPR